MMLHSINPKEMSGRTAWCGPSAIAIITGMDITEAHSLCAFSLGIPYDEVEGMTGSEVLSILAQLGYKYRTENIRKQFPELEYGPTLKRFFREMPAHQKMSVLLIETDRHFLASHFGMVCDNHTCKPVPWNNYHMLSAKVKAVHRIFQ